MSSTAKRSAKERVASLLDENSFVEIGALVTKRSTDFNLGEKEVPADGVITGYGTIDGAPVYVYSQDAAALNGTMGEMHARKITGIYDLALKTGAPVVGLVDCAGLRLQEATDALHAFGKIYQKQTAASGVIPQVTVVLGTCGGGVAVASSLSDITIMAEDGAKLFVNSPNTLDGNYEAKCNTSAAAYQAACGNVDVVCKGEDEAIAKARELVSLLPCNNEDGGVFEDATDDLNRMVASLGSSLLDSAVALREIADNGLFYEIKGAYAKEMVTGFLRLGGSVVGAVANRSEVLDEEFKPVEKFPAVLTAEGCEKAADFINFCDAFSIPVLSLTNVTGYQATIEQEKRVAKASARLTYAFANATVPKVNVITGKAYGSAYLTMNSKHLGADLVFAWPDAKIGMMDAKQAAQIIYADELEQAKDKSALLSEKTTAYESLQGSTESAAKRGYVDSIIEPASTRKHLIYAFEMLEMKRESRPDKKHGTV